MRSWVPTKYKTTNGLAYNEAVRQRGSLTIWFDPYKEWMPLPTGRRGRRQRALNVGIPYRDGAGPLNLLIDSTGFKAEGVGEWNARKHGGPKRLIWRKIHIGIDEERLEVQAVEVTEKM